MALHVSRLTRKYSCVFYVVYHLFISQGGVSEKSAQESWNVYWKKVMTLTQCLVQWVILLVQILTLMMSGLEHRTHEQTLDPAHCQILSYNRQLVNCETIFAILDHRHRWTLPILQLMKGTLVVMVCFAKGKIWFLAKL